MRLEIERPRGERSTPQYTPFGLSPPPSPTNVNRSTQTDAISPKPATPNNTPQVTTSLQRRGINFTDSGRSVSPSMTVARITARLEERERAQNALVED